MHRAPSSPFVPKPRQGRGILRGVLCGACSRQDGAGGSEPHSEGVGKNCLTTQTLRESQYSGHPHAVSQPPPGCTPACPDSMAHSQGMLLWVASAHSRWRVISHRYMSLVWYDEKSVRNSIWSSTSDLLCLSSLQAYPQPSRTHLCFAQYEGAGWGCTGSSCFYSSGGFLGKNCTPSTFPDISSKRIWELLCAMPACAFAL